MLPLQCGSSGTTAYHSGSARRRACVAQSVLAIRLVDHPRRPRGSDASTHQADPYHLSATAPGAVRQKRMRRPCALSDATRRWTASQKARRMADQPHQDVPSFRPVRIPRRVSTDFGRDAGSGGPRQQAGGTRLVNEAAADLSGSLPQQAFLVLEAANLPGTAIDASLLQAFGRDPSRPHDWKGGALAARHSHVLRDRRPGARHAAHWIKGRSRPRASPSGAHQRWTPSCEGRRTAHPPRQDGPSSRPLPSDIRRERTAVGQHGLAAAPDSGGGDFAWCSCSG